MADGPLIAEQQDDIMICETPEQTTDKLGNDGNNHSIEDKQMQSGSDRYLISNISKLLLKKMWNELYKKVDSIFLSII